MGLITFTSDTMEAVMADANTWIAENGDLVPRSISLAAVGEAFYLVLMYERIA